ncbi:MAG: T9SS C-terminal target domain-containing protein, partial [Calditrichaeota bacterium]
SNDLKPGAYKLALAVLDPAGRLPSLRFAIKNYTKGGRHPIGHIGFGTEMTNAALDSTTFDDPYTDKSLYYIYDPDVIGVTDKADSQRPQTLELFQNYPNPFNPTTTIPYQLSKASHVKLSIHNFLGQLVITLVDEPQAAGYHAAIWNGNDTNAKPMASGVYFYQLQTGNNSVQTNKLVLTK